MDFKGFKTKEIKGSQSWWVGREDEVDLARAGGWRVNMIKKRRKKLPKNE